VGNLDFTNNAGFSAYCVALLVAGVITIAVSALSSVWRAKASAVVIGILIGLASLGYGLYLIFAFKGGTYFISYYVFVAPVLWTVRLMRARVPGRRPQGHRTRAKQFKRQVEAGEVAYREQMAVSAAANQDATTGGS
jgi:hypothetical protein